MLLPMVEIMRIFNTMTSLTVHIEEKRVLLILIIIIRNSHDKFTLYRTKVRIIYHHTCFERNSSFRESYKVIFFYFGQKRQES